MKRTKECEECSKVSHCNNNDLFCEKFINSELQTAKEENERLNKANNDLINDTAKAIGNYDKLQQDLKVAREALSWLEALLRENYNDKENQIICVVFAYEKIQQALNQLKGGE